VMSVSRREGHTTRAASARTCWMNSKALVMFCPSTQARKHPA
jgi:hypothetical protein